MTQWSTEALAALSETHRRFIRLRLAQGRKATTETRVALVAFERGLSEHQLEQFYYVNRKGAKKRHFDTEAFAKKYGIDIRWIWDGDLREHTRGLSKQTPKSGRRPAQSGGDAA
jgi:hypothetical protein